MALGTAKYVTRDKFDETISKISEDSIASIASAEAKIVDMLEGKLTNVIKNI